MNITIKDMKHRHGNCVPFVLVNQKRKHIVYKGSLKEVAKTLKISISYASKLHRFNLSYKDTYRIKRVGFAESVNFI